MPKKSCKTSPNLALDIRNLTGMIANFASGIVHIPDATGHIPNPRDWRHSHFWMHGPRETSIEYSLVCRRHKPHGKFGPGTCETIEITRKGPGVKKLGLKSRTGVGNLYGLQDQLSRDMAKAYGAKLPRVAGFEGARSRRRRK